MTVNEYQRDCFKNYKSQIEYNSDYQYLFGNPINVLVPIETTLNKFMIVGAYPSAKFFTIKNVPDTPVYDNDSPFSDEAYFDGTRVRSIPSGKELNGVILSNIGIDRSECWITDLVKVFLFKQGHIDRYAKLSKANFLENRSKFDVYAEKSLIWLEREIEIANPKLIILLGLEVIKNVLKISESESKRYIDGKIKLKTIKGIERKFICIPHPGILMKKFNENPWPEIFLKEVAPKVKAIAEEIKKSIK